MPRSSPTTTPAAVIPVTLDGVTYMLKPPRAWMYDAEAALAAQRLSEAVRVILGPEQYAAWRATPRTVRDVEAFFAQVGLSTGARLARGAVAARVKSPARALRRRLGRRGGRA